VDGVLGGIGNISVHCLEHGRWDLDFCVWSLSGSAAEKEILFRRKLLLLVAGNLCCLGPEMDAKE
jgi:hypothetical protein